MEVHEGSGRPPCRSVEAPWGRSVKVRGGLHEGLWRLHGGSVEAFMEACGGSMEVRGGSWRPSRCIYIMF